MVYGIIPLQENSKRNYLAIVANLFQLHIFCVQVLVNAIYTVNKYADSVTYRKYGQHNYSWH